VDITSVGATIYGSRDAAHQNAIVASRSRKYLLKNPQKYHDFLARTAAILAKIALFLHSVARRSWAKPAFR
jgi:hypothetical protein